MHVPRAVDVFDHHQTDEIRIRTVVVKGEFHQLAQRLFGRQAVQLQFGLGLTHAAIGLIKDGAVQALFVPEIVKNHAFGRLNPVGNVLNAGARQAVFREFGARRTEDIRAHGLGVLFPGARLFSCVFTGFGHGGDCPKTGRRGQAN